MRVALVNKYWFQKGGTERVLFLTKQYLEDAGHEVVCFGMHDERNIVNNEFFVPHMSYDTAHGMSKVRAGINAIFNREAKKKFAAFLDAYAPDVIHVHNIYHQLSFSIFDTAKKRGIPIVMTLHDYKMMSPNYMMYHHGHVDMSMIGKKYYRCVLNNCMEDMGQSIVATVEAYVRGLKPWATQVSLYLAPSVYMADIAMRAGLPSGRVHVLPNPVDITGQSEDLVDGSTVVFFGRISPEKGVHTFLKSASLNPSILHIVLGTGPELDSATQYVQEHGLANVTFAGFLDGDALRNALLQARIVVVPSEWPEVAGMTIFEAYLLGKIVIGTHIGAIPESIPAEFLVPPGDHVALSEKIAQWFRVSFEERARRGRELQADVVSTHALDTYGKQLVTYYASVITS